MAGVRTRLRCKIETEISLTIDNYHLSSIKIKKIVIIIDNYHLSSIKIKKIVIIIG